MGDEKQVKITVDYSAKLVIGIATTECTADGEAFSLWFGSKGLNINSSKYNGYVTVDISEALETAINTLKLKGRKG